MIISDLIDSNVAWTILLIFHGLVSVALLGALTHQAFAVRKSAKNRNENFIDRFQGVQTSIYTIPICALWILTFILGGWIYANYRINVRIPIEQMGMMKTQGFFELKEHLSSFGLLLLPVYLALWKNDQNEFLGAKKFITYMLCIICWFSFLIGHVVNNVRGIGQ
jgi:predicted RND superfamily exporter protein